ncbi:MAG: hypothetical protein WCP21_09905 [Armatimonadota bacterium]
MRRTLAAAVALTLLTCLLPLAGHGDACVAEGPDVCDEACVRACCQPVLTTPTGAACALPQSSEQLRNASSTLLICHVPDAPFRPPEVL